MEEAIKLARLHGVGAVGVVNSNHFGAGALYARMAAKEGMIGISMTNVLPLVIAQGASKPDVYKRQIPDRSNAHRLAAARSRQGDRGNRG